MSKKEKTLIVLTGPTAVGKTDFSIKLAKKLNTEIISADARQFYKELKIGTAAPGDKELKEVKHHFVGHLSIEQEYNAYLFEKDALKVLNSIFSEKDFAILSGGSGLYIDAVCNGIDIIPDIDKETREKVQKIHEDEGLQGLRMMLKEIDPEYYKKVDPANPKRLMRPIEVFLQTGQKLSELHNKNIPKERPFNIVKVILNREREELFGRINKRTDEMIEQGFVEEAKKYFPYRKYNSLNTLGYKELFAYFDNEYSLALAIEKIKTNTRRYAKRQLTWFKKYNDAVWLHPETSNLQDILKLIE